jgi:transcriptional regulator with PAS, ATPase and Fis domain
MEARVRRRIYATGHVANYTFQDILGNSPQIKNVIYAAKEFAVTQSAILILGETGSGKEVFAQSIHNYSNRRQGPFVAINCAALPAQILESELFGYVAGAFTGASQKGKPGLFEIAHEGTIFLDEIGEMDFLTQGKLLRVLQEKKVMRLGSDKVLPIDVRVIAATNKNLKSLVNQNKFRADLYYRLNVLQLKIPPLRERRADLENLVNVFLETYLQPSSRHLLFTPAALNALAQYPWPGNIRELKNIVERIAAVCKSHSIDAPFISQMLKDEEDQEQSLSTFISNNELDEIKKALAEARGNRTQAAKILGISRSTLWRKLGQLGLS